MKTAVLLLALCSISCVAGGLKLDRAEDASQNKEISQESREGKDDRKKDDILNSSAEDYDNYFWENVFGSEKEMKAEEKNKFINTNEPENKLSYVSLMTSCKKECLVKSPNPSPCPVGCHLMKTNFDRTVVQYPFTPQKDLLGNAIDKCRDGCLEVDFQISECCFGCAIMQNIIRTQVDPPAKNLKQDHLSIEVKDYNKADNVRLDSSEEQFSNEIEDGPWMDLSVNKGAWRKPIDEGNNKDVAEGVWMNSKFDGKPEEAAEGVWMKSRDDGKPEEAAEGIWMKFKDKEAWEKPMDEGVKIQDDAIILDGTIDEVTNENQDIEQMYYIVMNPQEFLQRLIFINYLKSVMDGQPGGWSIDQQQMDIPNFYLESADTQPSTADILSSKTDKLIKQTSAAFHSAKEKIRTTLENVDVRQFMMITLLGICLGLLVSNLLEWVLCSKKKRTVPYTEDYYTLKKEPYNAVLPTYAECVTMDKKYLQVINEGLEPLMTTLPKKNGNRVETV